MSKPPSLVQLPFTGGVDQRIADEYQDPSSRLLDALNVIWAKEGAAQKRPGLLGLASTQVPGDPAMGTPKRLLTQRAVLLAHDGDKLFAYGSGVQAWGYRGLASPCVATRSVISGNASLTADTGVMAEGSGIRALVYSDLTGANLAGNILVSLYDAANGATIQLAYALTGTPLYFAPVPIILGGYLYVFFTSSGGSLLCDVMTIATLTWAGASAIVADAQPTTALLPGFVFDAVPEVGGNGILIVYAQAGTGTSSSPRYLRLEALPALTITASAVIQSYSGTATTTLLSARYNAALGVTWFAWETQTGASYARFAAAYSTSAWGVVCAVSSVTVPGSSSSSTAASLAVEPATATTMQYLQGTPTATASASYAISAGAASQTATQIYVRGSVVTRPFPVTCGSTQRMCALFSFNQTIIPNGTSYGTFFVIDLVSARVLATVAPRQAGNMGGLGLLSRRFASFTNPASPGAGIYRFPVVVGAPEEFGVQYDQNATYFLHLLTLDFTGATAWQPCEGGGETFASGGVTSYFDGTSIQELGFLEWPTNVASAINTTTGNLTNGTYGYAVSFGQMDAAGFIHRSATWTMPVITTNVINQITLTIPNLAWTSRYQGGAGTPVAEIWRTAVNGTTYYYVGSVACVPNSPTAALTFVDGIADSNIATNAILYTTGGVLDSVCPPSLRCLITHNQRLWGIDETGLVVWYTTPFNASDAVYFNEALTLSFTEGPLTALASMDDKLVIFTASRIKFLTGDGPANTGQGSDLTSPVVVMTDVGAADWRSVVSTPMGVLFQAPSGGIYLLGRDLSVSFIGKAVQDWVGTTSVVSAVLAPSTQQVRFLLATGIVIAFDYVLGRWSRFIIPAGATTQAVPPGAAAQTYYVAGAGGAYREKSAGDALPYYDTSGATNTWITCGVTTAWVKLGGLQGDVQLGHVLGYGRFLDACDVFVTLGFDYGNVSQGPEQFQYGTLTAANSVAAQWDAMAAAANTGAMAVQVALYDGPPTGGAATTGQGLRWLGVAFDLVQLTDRKQNLAAGVKQ